MLDNKQFKPLNNLYLYVMDMVQKWLLVQELKQIADKENFYSFLNLLLIASNKQVIHLYFNISAVATMVK